jgi:hypothetical protein
MSRISGKGRIVNKGKPENPGSLSCRATILDRHCPRIGRAADKLRGAATNHSPALDSKNVLRVP